MPQSNAKSLQVGLLLLALFFAGDRAGGWLLGNLVSLSQDRYVLLYEGESEADIVVRRRGVIRVQRHHQAEVAHASAAVTADEHVAELENRT